MKSRFPALLTAMVLLALAASPARADEQWIEVQSPHFTVLTDGGEKPGRDLGRQFEQMRSVFAQLFSRQVRQLVPLEIIALRSSKQFNEYAPLYQSKPVKTVGFYLRSQDRDYIVLEVDAPNRWETVFHEYAHLLLAANLPDLPSWFTEGFAEFYSTIVIDSKHATIGRPPEAVVQVLRQESLMPVATLFAVDHNSPVYNEDSDPRSIFYAESWLVVHYLWDHNRMEQAQRYFELLRQRVPIAEAIKQAFDVTPDQFDQALKKYSRSALEALTVPLPEGLEKISFSVTSVSSLTAMTSLAGVHAHQSGYLQQAIREFQEILQQDPDNAAAHRDLGYLYYYQHDSEAALPHLQKAAEKAPTDWRVHFFWAELAAAKNDDKLAPQIEKEARLVIELNPEFPDGYGLLGFAFMVEHRNVDAIAAYQTALRLKPQSDVYALNLAELYTLQGRLDEAKALFAYLQNSSNEMIAMAARSHLDLMASPRLKGE
ncbi:MAG TPA: tetratricopeptide repeat protein [Candidatus Angelobacter sp.]